MCVCVCVCVCMCVCVCECVCAHTVEVAKTSCHEGKGNDM